MLIAEELLLLSLDLSGRRYRTPSSSLEPAIGGAVLAELALRGRIDVVRGQGRRPGPARLHVLSALPTGDADLDQALAMLAQREGEPVKALISPLRRRRITRPLTQRLLDRMVRAGVVVEDRRHLLGVLSVTRWSSAAPEAAALLRARLRALVMGEVTADEREVALISLLQAGGLLFRVVSPMDRRTFRARVRTLTRADWAGQAVRAAIDEVSTVVAASAAAAASASD